MLLSTLIYYLSLELLVLIYFNDIIMIKASTLSNLNFLFIKYYITFASNIIISLIYICICKIKGYILVVYYYTYYLSIIFSLVYTLLLFTSMHFSNRDNKELCNMIFALVESKLYL